MLLDFEKELEEIKNKPIKRFSMGACPSWAFDSPIMNVFNNKNTLLKQGKICYGALLQANSMLFKSGLGNNPAVILYSFDSYFEQNPQELRQLGAELFKYKNMTACPPELQYTISLIKNERSHIQNLKLPLNFTKGREVFFTVVMVVRKHLPRRKITGYIFPVLAAPEICKGAIILPKNYWTDNLVDLFKGDY